MPSSKARQLKQAPTAQPSEFDEERIPFVDVLRKLVSTKPAHKATPVKRPATKAAKKP